VERFGLWTIKLHKSYGASGGPSVETVLAAAFSVTDEVSAVQDRSFQ